MRSTPHSRHVAQGQASWTLFSSYSSLSQQSGPPDHLGILSVLSHDAATLCSFHTWLLFLWLSTSHNPSRSEAPSLSGQSSSPSSSTLPSLYSLTRNTSYAIAIPVRPQKSVSHILSRLWNTSANELNRYVVYLLNSSGLVTLIVILVQITDSIHTAILSSSNTYSPRST